MSEWKKVKLEDVCEITSSKRIYLSDYVSTGIPFYRSKEIIEKKRGADITNFLYISKEKYDNIKKNFGVPQSGDLLVTSVGSLGIPYVIMDEDPFYFKDGNLIWFKNFCKCLNSKFLYYWMCSSAGHSALLNIAIGSAQKALTISAFKNFSIYIPQIEVQNRLVEILSRYDSLIENYKKQIKLLEEAAQRLYKEWFVDLRFPGYENTPVVDGVPEGWEKKRLGEVSEFRRGKTITKKDTIDGNIPVIAGGLEPAYYCNKYNTSNRVITISGSGANAGFTRMYYENVWASDCSYVDSASTEYLHFTYCFLLSNKKAIDNMQKGSAQPHVYAKDINRLDVVVPDLSILDRFEFQASSIFDKIKNAVNQIKKLTEARDRLLPKLMSGEIEV